MHYPVPLQAGIIYGPIPSKRLGTSLGINLLPTTVKVCSFDCLYCFYGRTDFKVEVDLCPGKDEVLSAVEEALQEGRNLDYITFSGNGAATMHPEYLPIVIGVAELRNRYYPGTPIALLSNSTELDKPEVIEALYKIDHPIMKLDTGDEAVFRKLNRPRKGIKLQDIIDNLSKLKGVTLQTVLVDGEAANFKGEAWEKWLGAVKTIKPQAVQIYSLDESIPEMGVYKVDDDTIFRLAKDAEDKTGVLVKGFKERK